jgi:hypothetical protein
MLPPEKIGLWTANINVISYAGSYPEIQNGSQIHLINKSGAWRDHTKIWGKFK